MRRNGIRPNQTSPRLVTAATLGITAALALQSASALGGQPEDELSPLRAEVAALAARYTEYHPDVVKARYRLDQKTMVVSAWQCLETVHQRELPLETEACVSHGEGLSAVEMTLMDRLIDGRDMADLTERAQTWFRFRDLSSYYENVTRQWISVDSGNAFPRVPRSDWLLLIDALDRAGDFDGACREVSKFESQSSTEWFDCSGPLREEDFVVFMSARLAAVEEHVTAQLLVPPLPGNPGYSGIERQLDQLREMFERCAAESLGWSAADVAVWTGLLRGRKPTGFEDSAERARILHTFNESRLGCEPEIRTGVPEAAPLTDFPPDADGHGKTDGGQTTRAACRSPHRGMTDIR